MKDFKETRKPLTNGRTKNCWRKIKQTNSNKKDQIKLRMKMLRRHRKLRKQEDLKHGQS